MTYEYFWNIHGDYPFPIGPNFEKTGVTPVGCGVVVDNITQSFPFFGFPKVARKCCQVTGCYEKVTQAINSFKTEIKAQETRRSQNLIK